LLGWTAITNQLDPHGLLLVLIIFIWTPAHFWSLAIHRYEDYAKADIPMLPVTHGIHFTKRNIVLYVLLLFAVSLMPFACGMSGIFYLIMAVILNSYFLYQSIVLLNDQTNQTAIKNFHYSNIYLMTLFVALLVDHYFK
jgi:protoheme IX farnesyltransferase